MLVEAVLSWVANVPGRGTAEREGVVERNKFKKLGIVCGREFCSGFQYKTAAVAFLYTNGTSCLAFLPYIHIQSDIREQFKEHANATRLVSRNMRYIDMSRVFILC